MSKLTSTWRLTRSSLASWRRHLKILTIVTAAVAVPANIIQLAIPSGDSSVSAYLSLAAIVMNLALIWTVIQVEHDRPVTLARAYYEGTASFVRFLLVSLVIVLELIPLALALLLYNVGIVGAAPGTVPLEKGFVGLLVLLLALPSLWLVNRSVLALVIAPATTLRPWAVLGQSWRSVKGHSWQVLGRLVGLAVAALGLLAIPALVLVFLYDRTANRGWLALLQVLTSVLILPFINLYLYKLYRELAGEEG